jgi:hypothetical protein
LWGLRQRGRQHVGGLYVEVKNLIGMQIMESPKSLDEEFQDHIHRFSFGGLKKVPPLHELRSVIILLQLGIEAEVEDPANVGVG